MFESAASDVSDRATADKLGLEGEVIFLKSYSADSVEQKYVKEALDRIERQGHFDRLFAEAEHNEHAGGKFGASIIEQFKVNGVKDTPEYNMALVLNLGEGYDRRCLGTLRCTYESKTGHAHVDLVRFDGVRTRQTRFNW